MFDRKLFCEICDTPALSGFERLLNKKIIDMLKHKFNHTECDKIGNVFAYNNYSTITHIIECGLDEPGIMVTSASDKEKINFVNVGSIKNILSQKVSFINTQTCGKKNHIGIVCSDEDAAKDISKMYIESESASIGDFGVIEGDTLFGETTVRRFNLSCKILPYMLLVTALSYRGGNNTMFLFTAQKQLNGKGLRAALNGILSEGILKGGMKNYITLNTEISDTFCSHSEIGLLLKDKNIITSPIEDDELKTIPKIVSEENYHLDIAAKHGLNTNSLILPIKHKGMPYEAALISNIELMQKMLLQYINNL